MDFEFWILYVVEEAKEEKTKWRKKYGEVYIYFRVGYLFESRHVE